MKIPNIRTVILLALLLSPVLKAQDVKMMVVYTPGVSKRMGSDKIATSKIRANCALNAAAYEKKMRGGRIKIKASYIGRLFSGYDVTRSMENHLKNLKKGGGPFLKTRRLRNARKIDLLFLVAKGKKERGLASLTGGFAAMRADVFTTNSARFRYTMGHEMGHIFGATHAKGHCIREGSHYRHSTIMSVRECFASRGAGGAVGTRIPHFSHPNFKIGSSSLGNGKRNNRAIVLRNARKVSNIRK